MALSEVSPNQEWDPFATMAYALAGGVEAVKHAPVQAVDTVATEQAIGAPFIIDRSSLVWTDRVEDLGVFTDVFFGKEVVVRQEMQAAVADLDEAPTELFATDRAFNAEPIVSFDISAPDEHPDFTASNTPVSVQEAEEGEPPITELNSLVTADEQATAEPAFSLADNESVPEPQVVGALFCTGIAEPEAYTAAATASAVPATNERIESVPAVKGEKSHRIRNLGREVTRAAVSAELGVKGLFRHAKQVVSNLAARTDTFEAERASKPATRRRIIASIAAIAVVASGTYFATHGSAEPQAVNATQFTTAISTTTSAVPKAASQRQSAASEAVQKFTSVANAWALDHPQSEITSALSELPNLAGSPQTLEEEFAAIRAGLRPNFRAWASEDVQAIFDNSASRTL